MIRRQPDRYVVTEPRLRRLLSDGPCAVGRCALGVLTRFWAELVQGNRRVVVPAKGSRVLAAAGEGHLGASAVD